MKRLYFFIACVACLHLISFAQTTSLTVDCQNPGKLSTLINESDQQTIRSLKVTGIINQDDLKFIGRLIQIHSLDSCIDLSEAVSSFSFGENVLGLTKSDTVSTIFLPRSLMGANKCFSESDSSCTSWTPDVSIRHFISINYLYCGGYNMHRIAPYSFSGHRFISYSNFNIKNIIFFDGTDSIADFAFYTYDKYNQGLMSLETVQFPEGLRCIGKAAFQKCKKLTSINIPNTIKEIGESAFQDCSVLSNGSINKFKYDSLEIIGNYAFYETRYNPDTIYWPTPMNVFYNNSFPSNTNQVVYLSENINYIKYSYWSPKAIHIKATQPPLVEIDGPVNNDLVLKNTVVYVPKGYKEPYESQWPWSNATIVEDSVYAQAIILANDSITLIPNESMQLIASVFPDNADTDVNWASSDNRVASVDASGVVFAKNKGTAVIYATTTDGSNLVDSCLVTVVQPVVGVAMEKHSLHLNVGGSEQLYANVLPVNADNKRIIWSSTDNEIAEVDAEGNVTALKPGIAFIKATSEDNPFAVDSCKLTVLQPVTGITLNYSKYGFNQIGATAQLIATITPDDASNKEVQWHSSNESICFISNGTIVSTGYGTCVVLATTVDGGHLASCIVDVYKSGDVNRDGVINIGDITTIIDMLLNRTASEYDCIWADMNVDGIVNINDVTDLIDQLLNSSN